MMKSVIDQSAAVTIETRLAKRLQFAEGLHDSQHFYQSGIFKLMYIHFFRRNAIVYLKDYSTV